MSLSVNRNGAKLDAGWLAAMATPPGGAVRSGWPFVPMEPDA